MIVSLTPMLRTLNPAHRFLQETIIILITTSRTNCTLYIDLIHKKGCFRRRRTLGHFPFYRGIPRYSPRLEEKLA